MRTPRKTTVRTIFQVVVGLAAGLPAIVLASGIPETTAGVGITLAVAGAVTRIMALPEVDRLLPSWLSTASDNPS